ncbi:methylaspartate mutase [Streptomyces iconiensis]|uniref:Methylaspartate mutase n=1 Tax=Streptomyces iconiensis TaxID=1384038 RepID=A0ABT6ZUL6_9ACTN|nr:methylaspartate mutase [Streptomyces iconiensis]MDJ1132755.1 methylaspartate mutase [Streptomyces iconiensis]
MTDSTGIPPLEESVAYIRSLGKESAAEVLARSRDTGRVAVQPRCGVGGHDAMYELLGELEAQGAPDLLTLTIDSHTRLGEFERARRLAHLSPRELNGYPLVAHGWRRGRELNESVRAPLQIRHGSPDARLMFEVTVASGITSFEGGGISYNLPYSKDVALADSLAAWEAVDRRCGELAELGVIVDRELFGTLTAVLIPPSVSLAISVLEAVLAARAGVRCISVAYPQSGHVAQDVAALRAIPLLARRYVPAGADVHAVFHEFMGVFPQERHHAEDLILYGALVARLGGASKMLNKTYQEALGIPDAAANAAGIRLAQRANSPLLGFVTPDEEQTAQELDWILTEVAEIVEPVLERPGTQAAVAEAFADGRLDIPFSASKHARSEVIPRRDPSGAIRYLSAGRLPLSPSSLRRHREQLRSGSGTAPEIGSLLAELTADINYFPLLFGETAARDTQANPLGGPREDRSRAQAGRAGAARGRGAGAGRGAGSGWGAGAESA